MRMRTLLGAGAAALTLAAAPALAQDGEPAFDGLYVGGSVGYTVQNNDVGETIEFDAGRDGSFGDTIATSTGANAFSPGFCNGAATSSANVACTNDKDDLEYYGRIGFDKQMGKVVIGAVAEFGKTQARDSVSAYSTTPAFYTMTRELDWNAALRLRAGLVAGESTLFYATGGGAYAKLDNSFSSSNTANSFTLEGDDMAWGWQAGGGVEQKIGRNFSIGLEYLYSRYDDSNARVAVGTGTAGATNPFVLAGGADFRRSSDFDFHSLRATAAFRF
ncbi:MULTISPECIES: outer membrane protein [unclassified Sphingomonas]|uniref:outer membrane protein n=1 Tax=unclassified Sphingomonas TaxID=196159 RepID=UPI002150D421|nr:MULTISPECIES: outer membrane beta-barrel protein [unclassified Sphingomonas]MCR5871525.1 outer membrane beta-barrel protein [Sphingomonas sp. J344]UUY00181.1 outer membrane beta-barrel protein [Sphingomonas sp. J315]